MQVAVEEHLEDIPDAGAPSVLTVAVVLAGCRAEDRANHREWRCALMVILAVLVGNLRPHEAPAHLPGLLVRNGEASDVLASRLAVRDAGLAVDAVLGHGLDL
eukprot:991131-Pyramimonas_sp.AAC.1